MNSGYFYAPYIPLDDEKDPAAAGEKPQEDFPYEIGEEVWVQGAPERQYGISWRARIVKRWYEEDCEKAYYKYSPYWFVVEAIDPPPSYRQKEPGWPIIVGEGEIARYKNEYPGSP